MFKIGISNMCNDVVSHEKFFKILKMLRKLFIAAIAATLSFYQFPSIPLLEQQQNRITPALGRSIPPLSISFHPQFASHYHENRNKISAEK